ncbi:uncharacterized protein V6R79_025902 [Siganus canaliculatus]
MQTWNKWKRGPRQRSSWCHESGGKKAAQSAMLHAAGADAAAVNGTESTGDPARLIRLPLSPPNESPVIEYRATALRCSSLSLLIALYLALEPGVGCFHCKH